MKMDAAIADHTAWPNANAPYFTRIRSTAQVQHSSPPKVVPGVGHGVEVPMKPMRQGTPEAHGSSQSAGLRH